MKLTAGGSRVAREASLPGSHSSACTRCQRLCRAEKRAPMPWQQRGGREGGDGQLVEEVYLDRGFVAGGCRGVDGADQ